MVIKFSKTSKAWLLGKGPTILIWQRIFLTQAMYIWRTMPQVKCQLGLTSLLIDNVDLPFCAIRSEIAMDISLVFILSSASTLGLVIFQYFQVQRMDL